MCGFYFFDTRREGVYILDSRDINVLYHREVRLDNLTLKVKKIIILRYPNL